jgi:hypothetical protein
MREALEEFSKCKQFNRFFSNLEKVGKFKNEK